MFSVGFSRSKKLKSLGKKKFFSSEKIDLKFNLPKS